MGLQMFLKKWRHSYLLSLLFIISFFIVQYTVIRINNVSQNSFSILDIIILSLYGTNKTDSLDLMELIKWAIPFLFICLNFEIYINNVSKGNNKIFYLIRLEKFKTFFKKNIVIAVVSSIMYYLYYIICICAIAFIYSYRNFDSMNLNILISNYNENYYNYKIIIYIFIFNVLLLIALNLMQLILNELFEVLSIGVIFSLIIYLTQWCIDIRLHSPLMINNYNIFRYSSNFRIVNYISITIGLISLLCYIYIKFSKIKLK